MRDAAFSEVKERGSLITVRTTVCLEVKTGRMLFFLEVKRERIADFWGCCFFRSKKRGCCIFESKKREDR